MELYVTFQHQLQYSFSNLQQLSLIVAKNCGQIYFRSCKPNFKDHIQSVFCYDVEVPMVQFLVLLVFIQLVKFQLCDEFHISQSNCHKMQFVFLFNTFFKKLKKNIEHIIANVKENCLLTLQGLERGIFQSSYFKT